MLMLIDTVLMSQALLGAFDNLWHHEWQARLPQQRGARRELVLHAAREALYGALFLGLGWWAWHGLFAYAVAAVLAMEVVITLADFLEEDRTRRLPPFERWLHTVLTLSYGLFATLMGQQLLGWAQLPTGLVSAERGWVTGVFTAFAMAVWAWSVRNALAARRLKNAPLPLVKTPVRGADAVLVTGGTGFLGSALVASLREDGQRVIVLTRDVRQARLRFDAQVAVVESLDEIAAETRISAIVHLAGARVLGLPWTAARRRQLMESRTRISADLLSLIRRLEQRPKVLIAASAVGYYGVPVAGALCDESAPAMPGVFQSDLCAAIEHEARRAEGLDVRVVRLRLGVVLGREDGAYPMQALAARLGLAAELGNGQQPAPWIHRDDAVGLVKWAMDDASINGPVNAVAPELSTQRDFVKALAASFGRPAWARFPAAPLRLLAGEMSTLLLDGQAVVPARALAGGYRFSFPTLTEAFADLA